MKVPIVLFLIALLIVGAIFAVGSWTCNQPPIPNGETQKTEQTQPKYCSTPSAALIVGLHTTDAAIHENREEIVAVSTFIIAIFTIILGIFTVSLARSTRIAADAANLSANAAIAIELPIIKAWPDKLGKGTFVKQNVQTEHVLVNYVRFSNVGRTKAFPVKLRYGFAIGALPEKPHPAFVETFGFDDIFEADPKETPKKFLSDSHPIDGGIWGNIAKGSLPVWFFCELTYLDFMQDAERKAGSCWRWQYVGDGMDWRPDDTPAYNY